MNDNDMELLELAAKAAGMKPSYVDGVIYAGFGSRVWGPLNDDGDALRLAAKLKIDLSFDNCGVEAVWIDEDISETYRLRENANDAFDGFEVKLSATRRAIVRAAAEIGKAMP